MRERGERVVDRTPLHLAWHPGILASWHPGRSHSYPATLATRDGSIGFMGRTVGQPIPTSAARGGHWGALEGTEGIFAQGELMHCRVMLLLLRAEWLTGLMKRLDCYPMS